MSDRKLFEQEHALPVFRQMVRRGTAHHPASHDDHISQVIAHRLLPVSYAVQKLCPNRQPTWATLFTHTLSRWQKVFSQTRGDYSKSSINTWLSAIMNF